MAAELIELLGGIDAFLQFPNAVPVRSSENTMIPNEEVDLML